MSDLSVRTARLAIVQRIHRMVTMGPAGGWNSSTASWGWVRGKNLAKIQPKNKNNACVCG